MPIVRADTDTKDKDRKMQIHLRYTLEYELILPIVVRACAGAPGRPGPPGWGGAGRNFA